MNTDTTKTLGGEDKAAWQRKGINALASGRDRSASLTGVSDASRLRPTPSFRIQ
ncbi:hypothetical protein HDA40_002037 [Hamadaea flava]|uniref:Uncharacterized protein n=1 Tax=Hamadaea flava TaxID=1742688 RepID=A0ABV8LKD9_9ACTN|nr:hypothetical protein [Hamadaea flava]